MLVFSTAPTLLGQTTTVARRSTLRVECGVETTDVAVVVHHQVHVGETSSE